MAERKNAEPGLVDAWTAGLGGPRTAALLSRLDAAIPWETLVEPVLRLPEYRGKRAGKNKGGRPALPALTMLECVLLAKWFGLSDPQLEECLHRSAERESRLRERGVCCAIAFKRRRGQKELPPLLAKLNRLIASVRAPVEHPFAWLKQMGCRRVRYRGRRRNEVDFALHLSAYNWKRSLSLTAHAARRAETNARSGHNKDANHHSITATDPSRPPAARSSCRCSGVPTTLSPSTWVATKNSCSLRFLSGSTRNCIS